ncbi:MAG: hypothetical protein ABSG52_04575 [Terriglobales bacterium]|jgi:hypothetical protein
MKLLVVAVLLAVMQAPPPAPRKAADNAASAGSKVQQETKAKKEPSAQPQSSINAQQAPDHDAAGNRQGNEGAQHSIIVRELPPVTVNPHKRDLADWGYWAFSGLLVVVGSLQVWLLCKTLRAVKASADAAFLNAQAVINAERAWVVAELHPMGKKRNDKHWVDDSGTLFTTEQLLGGKHEEYSLRIKNIGRTPAQIISFEMSYSCLSEGVTQLPSSSPDVSHVSDFEHLLANSDPIEILPPFNPGPYMKDSWLDIKALKKTAVFHGWVKYRHMLSDEDCWWDYCYVYTPSLDRLTAVGQYTKPRQKQPKTN